MFSPVCPVDVRVLAPEAAKAAVRGWLQEPARLLVLTSPRRSAALNLAAFFVQLQGDGHAVQLYGDIPPNPSVTDVAALLTRLQAQAFLPTAILVIGGGSCIDLGKAVAALAPLLPAPSTDAVRRAIESKTFAQGGQAIPLFAMPTTSGTGSEVTRWATIWDPEQRRKLSVDHADGFPKAAAVVPEWTLGMDAGLTLSTGLDALSHAMEAFWAVARNPLSQELALAAVRKVVHALPVALREPNDLAARQALCLGSVMAGLAFSQTRTTACHSMSYPLTMLRGVPHGYAAALTLGSVMRRNAKAVPDMHRLEALFDDAEGFDAWMEDTTRGVQEIRLSAFGVTQAELPIICQLAFTAGRMDNNPIVFTEDEVMAILTENL